MIQYPIAPTFMDDFWPPDYWINGPWQEFGAAIVPLRSIDSQWMVLNAVFPDGIQFSPHYFVCAQPIRAGKITDPILMIVPLASFQSMLNQFYERCQERGLCGLIKFVFYTQIDGDKRADLLLGTVGWDKIQWPDPF